MSKLVCAFAFTAIGLLSVEAHGESRIVGDQNAVNSQFPHHVEIRNISDTFSRRLHCSGSIISTRFVLTAARCVSGEENLRDLRVIAGDVDRQANAVQHRLDKVIIHPYATNFWNEIGVLAEPFTFTANVRAIRLPTADTPITSVGIASNFGRLGTIQSS